MKVHFALPLCLFTALLTVALSTGSVLFFMLALLVLLAVLSGLLSVLWAAATLTVTAELADRTLRRGDQTRLRLTARHRCLCPSLRCSWSCPPRHPPGGKSVCVIYPGGCRP